MPRQFDARRYGRVFDEVAEDYDRRRLTYPDVLVDRACEGAGIGRGAAVLEIRCGTGQLPIHGAGGRSWSTLFRRLFHAPGFIIPFEVLPFGFAIGMTTLSVGLRKAHIATRLSTICIGPGAIGLFARQSDVMPS
jgi:hypothetical protein